MVVPTRAPHTFSNETDEEAKFVNTFTPVCLIFFTWGYRHLRFSICERTRLEEHDGE